MSDQNPPNAEANISPSESQSPSISSQNTQISRKELRLQKKAEIEKEAKKDWATVGWHRPLAGFWFNYVLILFIALPGVIILGVVIPAIMPFPEAMGYANVITAYLMPIYLFADFGIKESIGRYISQYSETQPRRAMKYMSFFFYYQMFTGVLQVTLISWLAVTIIPRTNVGYASWLFLGFIMIQWPGTPGLFLTALNGFHQFDKGNIITLIQNVAIQSATQVGFILLGRWIGMRNPEIGELLGASWGFLVGTYLDDIIAIFVGAALFNRVLKPFQISLKEAFYTAFDKEIMKEVLLYGGKVLPSGLSYVGVSALITSMLVNWLFNYATWMGVYSIASGIVGALSISFSSMEPLSEAYNNNKKHLALYYIRSQFQWWGILSIGVFMAPILYLIPSIVALAAPEYSPIVWMVFPLFFGGFILFPSLFGGIICQACNIPEHATYCNFIEQGTRLLTYLVVLAPWGFRVWFGDEAVIFGWLFAEAPGYAAKGFYAWFVIKKKLFPNVKIEIAWYRTFIVPAICMIPMFPLSIAMRALFVVVFNANIIAGFGLAAGYLILLLYGFPIFYILPLYGFLGGWDDQALEDFRRAVRMSGPSRFLVGLLYRGTRWGYDHSPLKGKFPISNDLAMAEAKQLTDARIEAEKVSN